MRISMLCTLLCVFVLADAYPKKDKTLSRMLTNKTWTLVQYGFDENENGGLDAFEDHMDDCNRDDTYVFDTDGTGHYDDHLLSCGNGIAELSFQWNLLHHQNLISLPIGPAKIEQLTHHRLVLSTRAAGKRGAHTRRIVVLEN